MNLFSVFRELLEGQLTLLQKEAIRQISNSGFYRGRLKTRRGSQKKAPTSLRRRSIPFCPPADVNLKNIWDSLQQNFFPERSDLLEYTIDWSARRQKRTLASCNIRKKQINVAREMSLPQCHSFLEPLIYHEMCHAVLGDKVGRAGSKRLWHGPQFRSLERNHPEIVALDNWIKSGGWSKAVRSFRSSEYHKGRKEEARLLAVKLSGTSKDSANNIATESGPQQNLSPIPTPLTGNHK
jgi:hypothetical protein